ncbi:hypothetical protein A9Q89_03685 [Gammaproteobacteria bacterium 53_120_T64]|nr:hypothetical protein A9Q89_03685 [Gammaproteobacteria bacterium 53_120_T64]
MHDNLEQQAITEVALAMGMAFFALMVLALVGLNAPRPAGDAALPELAERHRVSRNQPTWQASEQASKKPPPLQLLIYYQGRYFDQQLKPINPKQVRITIDRRPLLAVAPTLSLNEAIDAKQALPMDELQLTVLDQRWLDRLEAMP